MSHLHGLDRQSQPCHEVLNSLPPHRRRAHLPPLPQRRARPQETRKPPSPANLCNTNVGEDDQQCQPFYPGKCTRVELGCWQMVLTGPCPVAIGTRKGCPARDLVLSCVGQVSTELWQFFAIPYLKCPTLQYSSSMKLILAKNNFLDVHQRLKNESW